MPTPVPALDQNMCSSWNENEINMYNSLPFYLAKFQIEYRKTYATHSRMIGKKRWTPNMGPIMRGVRKERSPNIRQEALPSELAALPTKDVIDVQEVTVQTTLKRHRFESRVFPFLPSFQDFLTDHVSFTMEDINQKIVRYDDLFVRTAIFHSAPFVYVCDAIVDANGEMGLKTAPMWDGADMSGLGVTTGKVLANRIQWANQLGQPGNLSLENVFIVDSIMREDLRVPPYSGGGMARDSAALKEKNVLVLSNEAYTQFIYDPFLLDNKQCNLNIITEGFSGDLFGRVICRIEDLPLRMALDGTFPAPEARELNPAMYNKNETVLTAAYKNAPLEWAFLYGAEGYQEVEAGPPPKDFTSNSLPNGFKQMFWNAEVRITKDFLVPCLDENGALVYEPNTYGEHLKLISQGVFGILATQRRNVIPILFKRARGA